MTTCLACGGGVPTSCASLRSGSSCWAPGALSWQRSRCAAQCARSPQSARRPHPAHGHRGWCHPVPSQVGAGSSLGRAVVNGAGAPFPRRRPASPTAAPRSALRPRPRCCRPLRPLPARPCATTGCRARGPHRRRRPPSPSRARQSSWLRASRQRRRPRPGPRFARPRRPGRRRLASASRKRASRASPARWSSSSCLPASQRCAAAAATLPLPFMLPPRCQCDASKRNGCAVQPFRLTSSSVSYPCCPQPLRSKLLVQRMAKNAAKKYAPALRQRAVLDSIIKAAGDRPRFGLP